MGVDVPESRRDGKASRVDDLPCAFGDSAHTRDAAVLHGDIAPVGLAPRTIDDQAVLDQCVNRHMGQLPCCRRCSSRCRRSWT